MSGETMDEKDWTHQWSLDDLSNLTAALANASEDWINNDEDSRKLFGEARWAVEWLVDQVVSLTAETQGAA